MAGVQRLKKIDIKSISKCKRKEGCHLLACRLGLVPYDKEKNMITDIYTDYLYDHLMFAVEKGIPWECVVDIVKFADRMLNYSKGKAMGEVIQWYRQEAEDLVTSYGVRFFKLYTEFIFSSFFSHYKLYQYVFTNKREEVTPNLLLEVTSPVSPRPLCDGTESHVFDYEQKYCEIEKRETERLDEILKEKDQLKEDGERKKEDLFQKLLDSENSISKENLKDMVKEVVSCYTSQVAQTMKSSILEAQESLDFKLQKACLPRPKVLGPPPRYKTKSPTLSKGKPATPKSRGSSAAKPK